MKVAFVKPQAVENQPAEHRVETLQISFRVAFGPWKARDAPAHTDMNDVRLGYRGQRVKPLPAVPGEDRSRVEQPHGHRSSFVRKTTEPSRKLFEFINKFPGIVVLQSAVVAVEEC